MTVETPIGSRADWDDQRKSALFADIVNRRLSLDQACERHALGKSEVQEWLRRFRRSALAQFDESLKQTLIDQGASAAALRAAEFIGTLDDISIADLLQTIQIAGKDAVITISENGVESHLWCAAGAVIDAESGVLVGEKAVHRLLSIERGTMLADLHPVSRTRRIHTSTQRLLLESARRKDECARLRAKHGDDAQLYRVAEQGANRAPSEAELALSRFFDVPRSIRDVIAASDWGDLETVTALHTAIESGYLVDAGKVATNVELHSNLPPSVNNEHWVSFLPHVTSQRPQRSTAVGWLAGALSAAALVATAYWLGTRVYETYEPVAAARALPAVPELSTAHTAPRRFELSTRVEPRDARLWLDGKLVGTGEFATQLVQDGVTHELRTTRDGFVPSTVFFVDTPPPREIRLEKLVVPAAPAGVSNEAAWPGPSLADGPPPKKRGPRPHAKAAPTNKTVSPAISRSEIAVAGAADTTSDEEPATPRVQVIE